MTDPTGPTLRASGSAPPPGGVVALHHIRGGVGLLSMSSSALPTCFADLDVFSFVDSVYVHDFVMSINLGSDLILIRGFEFGFGAMGEPRFEPMHRANLFSLSECLKGVSCGNDTNDSGSSMPSLWCWLENPHVQRLLN